MGGSRTARAPAQFTDESATRLRRSPTRPEAKPTGEETTVNILKKHLGVNTQTKKEVRERKDFRLPAIVPIVLYNGKDNWTSAMTLREYTENCEFFGNNIIDFRYLLLDLNRTDEGAIEPVENPLDAVFIVEKLRIRKKMTSDNLSNWWTEKTSGFSNEDKNMLINWMDKVYFNGKMSSEIMEILTNNPKKGSVAMKSIIEEMVEEMVEDRVDELKRQKALEIAQKMKATGDSIDRIIELTGLTVDDILPL